MCHGHKCPSAVVVCLLVIVGALNWGLVGLGMLMSKDLNVVHMLIGTWPTVEAVVYLLVGVAGVLKLLWAFTGCCFGACGKGDKCCSGSCEHDEKA